MRRGNVDEFQEGCFIVVRSPHCKVLFHIPKGEIADLDRLSSCSEIAMLIVGPSETKLSCHKALMGFFSEFFDAALYGNFKEGETNTVRLPEEAPDDVVAFVAWIYSGHIECDLNAARLWTLGDRLRSPDFCNDVMYLLMDTYGSYTRDSGQWLSAATVDYIYDHTTEESALRRFVRDNIISDGPLCERALKEQSDREGFKEEWIGLIRRGGDVVVDVAMVAGFSNDKDNEEAPYISANQHKYIVDMKGTRPIQDFVNGAKRGTLAWEVNSVPDSRGN